MPDLLLILSKDADIYKEQIEPLVGSLRMFACESVEDAQLHLSTANLLLASPALAVKVIHDMPKLRWFQSTWAGITPLVQANLRKDYQLTGVKGIFGPLMSEFVFAYILLFERRILEHFKAQQSKQWHPVLPRPLTGKTMGILGTGSIASHVATTAKHFGLNVKGYSLSGQAKDGFDEVKSGNMLKFLPELDYLVNTLPDTQFTRSLLTQKAFECMKNSSLFINIGRGTIVNETVLADALTREKIAGAALDVFQEEPLPQDSPLWTTPNTFITSHTSGPSFPKAVAEIFVRNYQHYLKGERLEYLIDFEKGY